MYDKELYKTKDGVTYAPIAPLKLKKSMVFEVDYYDLDTFINDYYGTGDRYEIVADDELMNDISKKFNIRKRELGQYDMNKIAAFKNGGRGSYMTHTLLTDLCNNDVIEPGTYLVNISW